MSSELERANILASAYGGRSYPSGSRETPTERAQRERLTELQRLANRLKIVDVKVSHGHDSNFYRNRKKMTKL